MPSALTSAGEMTTFLSMVSMYLVVSRRPPPVMPQSSLTPKYQVGETDWRVYSSPLTVTFFCLAINFR
ncbi:hypothetical protein 2209_scaffold2350_00034 [Bacteriophage sp.]|nr:hypothetical protein 2209_scaffold2350_00034 [Bacteriophage sp.]